MNKVIRCRIAVTMLIFSVAPGFGQDPSSFFPVNSGNLWEYDIWGYDTLQSWVAMDSTDQNDVRHVKIDARSIMPIGPAFFPAFKGDYQIDTSYRVFQVFGGGERSNVYRLDASAGDQWVVSGSGPYYIARVTDVYQDVQFGQTVWFMGVHYFSANDSTDSLGITSYFDELASGFGLVSRAPHDPPYMNAIGAVVDSTLYGDTTLVVSIGSQNSLTQPRFFDLLGNFPNPFNVRTTIRVRLSEADHVTVEVFDILGRKVKTLFRGLAPSGISSYQWEGTNDIGIIASSGVFFYRVQVRDQVSIGKMVLLK